VNQSIEANGGRGRRGESSLENPGPGFMKSEDYQLTLRSLTLAEYRYPGKNFISVSLIYLERLTPEDRQIMEQDMKPPKKFVPSAKNPILISGLSIPKEWDRKMDNNNIEYTIPWREYECIDGNHKLYVFETQ